MRNSRLELLRILLMYGIVLIHTSAHCVKDMGWLSYMMSFSVTGFVFLTGYFGTSFSLKKIVKLYGIAIISCLISGLTEPFVDICQYIYGAYRHLCGCWFVHTYAALLFIVPILNNACKNLSKSWFVPFVILTFGWSYIQGFGCVQSHIPTVVGLGEYSLLMMAGVYVAARVFKLCEIENKISTRKALLVISILLPFGALGFSRYNSFFTLALSASCVIVFSRIRLNGWIEKIVLLLSPSMFSIYVLHNSNYNEGLTSDFGAWLIHFGIDATTACIIAALVTFIICLAIDIVRRIILHIFTEVIFKKD